MAAHHLSSVVGWPTAFQEAVPGSEGLTANIKKDRMAREYPTPGVIVDQTSKKYLLSPDYWTYWPGAKDPGYYFAGGGATTLTPPAVWWEQRADEEAKWDQFHTGAVNAAKFPYLGRPKRKEGMDAKICHVAPGTLEQKLDTKPKLWWEWLEKREAPKEGLEGLADMAGKAAKGAVTGALKSMIQSDDPKIPCPLSVYLNTPASPKWFEDKDKEIREAIEAQEEAQRAVIEKPETDPDKLAAQDAAEEAEAAQADASALSSLMSVMQSQARTRKIALLKKEKLWDFHRRNTRQWDVKAVKILQNPDWFARQAEECKKVVENGEVVKKCGPAYVMVDEDIPVSRVIVNNVGEYSPLQVWLKVKDQRGRPRGWVWTTDQLDAYIQPKGEEPFKMKTEEDIAKEEAEKKIQDDQQQQQQEADALAASEARQARREEARAKQMADYEAQEARKAAKKAEKEMQDAWTVWPGADLTPRAKVEWEQEQWMAENSLRRQTLRGYPEVLTGRGTERMTPRLPRFNPENEPGTLDPRLPRPLEPLNINLVPPDLQAETKFRPYDGRIKGNIQGMIASAAFEKAMGGTPHEFKALMMVLSKEKDYLDRYMKGDIYKIIHKDFERKWGGNFISGSKEQKATEEEPAGPPWKPPPAPDFEKEYQDRWKQVWDQMRRDVRLARPDGPDTTERDAAAYAADGLTEQWRQLNRLPHEEAAPDPRPLLQGIQRQIAAAAPGESLEGEPAAAVATPLLPPPPRLPLSCRRQAGARRQPSASRGLGRGCIASGAAGFL